MDPVLEKSTENLDWNVDTEVQLFHAMKGHKPVGAFQLVPSISWMLFNIWLSRLPWNRGRTSAIVAVGFPQLEYALYTPLSLFWRL